jgi:fibronectin-binding autotransporter adhesin
MKIKSLLIAVFCAAALSASAYNHKWTGEASGSWQLGENWTNNFPNPIENGAMRLFLPFLDTPQYTIQDVTGLTVDYLEVDDLYYVGGGVDRKLSFRDTNATSASVTMMLTGGCITFGDDLEIGLTTAVAISAAGSQLNPVRAYFNGPITGPGAFYKYGSGPVEIGGSAPNTYAGLTYVGGGTLQLNKSGGLAVPGDLQLGFSAGGGNNPAIKALFLANSQLAQNAHVTINGFGWLDLNDHAQTIGGLTMMAGRVSTGTGMLTMAGHVTNNPGNEESLIEGNVGLGFIPRTFTVGGNSTTNGLRITANVVGNSAASLIKNGPGWLTISGAKSYHGGTTINEGIVYLANAATLGNTVGGTTVNNGATLYLSVADLGDESLTLTGAGVNGLGALFTTGSSLVGGDVVIPTSANVRALGTLALNGVVSGPGDLHLTGGTAELNGSSVNTLTGAIRVDSGTLELRKHLLILGSGTIGVQSVPGALFIGGGASAATVRHFYDNEIADATVVTIGANGLFDLNDRSDTIGSLLGSNSGAIDLGSGELTVGGNGNSTTNAAPISGAGGRLRKVGLGALTLTGANPYSGATTIEGGKLVINSTQLNSAVTVKSNATLAGNGLIGTLTAQRGIVAPGTGIGRLSSKSVVFDANSEYRASLNGAQPVLQYNQLFVTGTVNLGGAKLTVALNFASPTNSSFIIIANDGADAVQGTFAGLPEGQYFYANSTQFQITYHGGDGNDVMLTQTSITMAPHLDSLTELPNGHAQVNGTGIPFHLYTIERSGDLQNWTPLDTVAANDAGKIHYEDADGFSWPKAFYRLLAVDDSGPE